MDIGKAFGFVFEDDRWVTKILIAAAITLGGIVLGVLVIPAIVAFALVSGYGVEITRRVIRGGQPVLPEWENWGELFVDGLKVWVIGIVYALPIILVSVCLGTPAGLLSEDAPGWSAVLSSVSGCITFLWALVMSLFLPAAIAMFVADDQLSSAFRFGDVFRLVRDNFSTYLIVLVLSWVAGLIGGLGFVFCFFPGLATAPYGTMVTNHLYGQAYLEARGKTSQPVVVEEDIVA